MSRNVQVVSRMRRMMSGYHGAGILFWTMNDEGIISIYLGKRCHGIDRGRWSIPGGGWKRQDGTSPGTGHHYHKTAVREVHEETGFVIQDDDGLTCFWSIHVPFFHFEVFDYSLKEQIDFPALSSSEFSEGKWFPLDDLASPLEPFVTFQVRNLRKKIARKVKLREVI